MHLLIALRVLASDWWRGRENIFSQRVRQDGRLLALYKVGVDSCILSSVYPK